MLLSSNMQPIVETTAREHSLWMIILLNFHSVSSTYQLSNSRANCWLLKNVNLPANEHQLKGLIMTIKNVTFTCWRIFRAVARGDFKNSLQGAPNKSFEKVLISLIASDVGKRWWLELRTIFYSRPIEKFTCYRLNLSNDMPLRE